MLFLFQPQACRGETASIQYIQKWITSELAHFIQVIAAMYTNTRARVVSPNEETELFDITAGVLQGDTLAPFLFIIVIDYALRKAMDGK